MKWVLLLLSLLLFPVKAEPLKVGSKRFTESYILGEILVRTAGDATHRQGLGNTGIVFAALKAGSIDLYPEYTGTIAKEILKLEGNPSLADLHRELSKQGFGAGVPLGFHNGYALAMGEERAKALGIRTLSELAGHPDLKLGLSQEFIGRADGWAGLKAAYLLQFATPSGLDHGLAYEAIAAGRIDVMDIYTTDAKIERYKLIALEDDRKYFPRYDAVLLYRLDMPKRFPEAWAKLQKLEGRIDEKEMIRLNAAAELDKRSFAEAAGLFFDQKSSFNEGKRNFWKTLFGPDFPRLTGEHLVLVFVSLAASITVGIPLGILAQKIPTLSQAVLGAVGVIQTIPSLALFAFLIALMGAIGTAPALVALFLYALLPIVRNTYAGLDAVGKGMRQAALALGLRPVERLKLIELPLALPSILAGIKTSAVINVGTATIAAFVGAGGYGERIVSGLALNDNATLLAGAVPAALRLDGARADQDVTPRRRHELAGKAQTLGAGLQGPAADPLVLPLASGHAAGCKVGGSRVVGVDRIFWMVREKVKRSAIPFLVSIPAAALAAPNEIKVFTDELAAFGEHTLETHVNKASRAGARSENRASPLQAMPEYSYGIRRNWELSLQLPFSEAQGKVRSGGYRAELQYVAPHDDERGFYWGLNIEAARGSGAGEPEFSNLELIPILGFRVDRWHLAANPGVNRRISGGDRATTFEPAAKVAYRVEGRNYLGIEYYLEAGPLRRWLPRDQRGQVVYLAWDGKIGKSDINLAIGRGTTSASDRWVVKMIYEISF